MRPNVKKIICCFAVLGMLMAGTVLAQTAETTKLDSGSELLPPNARPGECYARVFVPPTYRTTTEQVLKRQAASRVETIPPKYRWVEEKVLVKEASERLELVPARYQWVEERVLVKPASFRMEAVPAVYETVSEQVLERPAQKVWKKGRGPLEKVDNGTGEIMCLVEIPPVYRTVTKRVLKTPATTRKIEIPAEYKTVRKQVMSNPPTTRKVTIPAEYKTVRVQQLVEEAKTRTIEIPAEYQTVSKTVKISDGQMAWRPILCQTNATRQTIQAIQRALAAAGFNPGPIDGVIGRETSEAVRRFQKAKGLAQGYLTIETLQALGVRL